MDKSGLRDSFLASLQRMYDMEVVAPLMEFCQGEMRVLLYLDTNYPTEIYPSDLSSALYVTRQRITTILTALRKKGYISMETSESDRRRMRVLLSDSGRAYVRKKRKFVQTYFDQLYDCLGEENMLEFKRLIDLTAEKMEGFSHDNNG